MIEHYNAFISYRHAPLDSRVAGEIQTQLERFRIPKAIQKSSGVKKIYRIFRDKEELLITSDLNDTIEHALVHSDFLIVICSHATKESVWVQREIEFFLKTHSKDRVLTVVAEGEPVDVVPPILREREATVTLDDGSEETVTMPMEPLSCDYRGDFRKARKEELPRLVAAMLGCSYDELKQRQRQYRVRRMTAAFSAVAVLLAALSAYYAWSASQIQQNYLESLKNQSQYLSAESLTLLENGDRMSAMLLALEALPKDDKDERPVLPEAEYALSQAVNAYVSPNTNWYAVEYAFPHGGAVNAILPSTDENRLAVLHSNYSFTLWDVQTREKLTEQVLDAYIRKAAVSTDDQLLILTSDALFSYDMYSGTLLWQMDTTDPVTSASAEAFALSDTAPLAALPVGQDMLFLDTETGAVVDTVPMPTHADTDLFGQETERAYNISFGEFSPDNQKLFLHLHGDQEYLALCDRQTDAVTVFDLEFFLVEDAVFTDDGNVVFIGMYYMRNGNYWIRPLYYYEDGFSEVACIDPEGRLLWAEEIHYTEMDVGLGSEVHPFTYQDTAGNTVSAVAAVSGEKMVFLDTATGDILEEHAYTAAIVTLSVFDEHISATLADGMLGQYIFSEHLNMAGDFCIEGIDLAADNTRLFVSDSETGTVLLYTYALHDDNWTEMPMEENAEDPFYSFDKYIAGDTLLLTRYSGLDQPFVVIDTQARTARICTLPEGFMEDKFFKGLSSDGKAILLTNYDDNTVVGALLLDTMQYEPNYYSLPSGWSELLLRGNNIYYKSYAVNADGSHSDGLTRQTIGGDAAVWEIPTVDPEAYLMSNFLLLTENEDMALLQERKLGQEPRYHTLDLRTGALHHTQPIPKQASYADAQACWSADGTLFFVASENCIFAFDRSCREVYRISSNGMTAGSLFSSGEDLFVLYGANTIYRYRISDGAFLNKIEMDNGNVSITSDCRWDDSQPGILALFNNDTLNIIDTQRWVVKTRVDDCLSFDLQKGLIFTAQSGFDNRMHFGYYEIYDYRQLIEMAKAQLEGLTLSPEMRAKYGVG